MTAAAAIPADDEALRRAYQVISQPHWPPYESVMDDPVYSRLVRGTAYRLAHGLPVGRVTEHREVQRPWTPPPMPTHQPAANDRKRAAAGDRDE